MAQVGNRVRGTRCPYCTNHKILKGYNDLETTHPEIAKQWNYEKNNGIKPNEVFAAGKYKFWWKCEKGHEWKARLYERKDGNGCPYCSNKKVLERYNDLQTTNPKLAKQWNYEKNKGLKPTQITAGSNKCVWWKCQKGHEWKATIASRNNGNGCPYCAHVKIGRGINDIMTLEPSLLKIWNKEKNKDIDPFLLSSCSNKKVWWKCANEHEWERSIYAIRRNPTCPKCKEEFQINRKVEKAERKRRERK